MTPFRSRPGFLTFVRFVSLTFVLSFGSSLDAQWLSREFFKNGPAVREAFGDVIRNAGECTVAILERGEQVALGAIVSADGLIVTKASEVDGRIRCLLKNGRSYTARKIAIDDNSDLAILKIDAQGLTPVRWRRAGSPREGQWVITPGLGAIPLAVGVVSVAPRSIPRRSGFLGVLIEDDGARRGARIGQVLPDTAADEAGLLQGDVVTHADGEPVVDRDSLVQAIRKHHPGTNLVLSVVRGSRELDVQANLRSRDPSEGNRLLGERSRRRSGFPRALQHDTVLLPNECGGPIFDLDGRAVGINIARADRTHSLALTSQEAISVLEDLLPRSVPAEMRTTSESAGDRVVFE